VTGDMGIMVGWWRGRPQNRGCCGIVISRQRCWPIYTASVRSYCEEGSSEEEGEAEKLTYPNGMSNVAFIEA